MALKRSIADTEHPDRQNEPRASRKRTRLSPSATAVSDNSTMSSGSVSKASALSSTPDIAMRAQDSSLSAPSHVNEDDSDSSMESSDDSASSSEDEEEDGDNDEAMREGGEPVILGGPKKPRIDAGVLAGAGDLASRLKAFLPQMQQANSELAERGAGMSMEDVDDEEEHIEMSLGLGVLEQKKEQDLADLLRKKSQPGSDDENGSGASDQASDEEPDVLDRLMNMERDVAKTGQPGIEEVESRSDRDVAPAATKSPSENHHNHLTLRQSGHS